MVNEDEDGVGVEMEWVIVQGQFVIVSVVAWGLLV